MELAEIQAAVDAGQAVHWEKSGYRVVRDGEGYSVLCASNGYMSGLTWRDGVTMNGKPEQFYICESCEHSQEPRPKATECATGRKRCFCAYCTGN